MDIWKNGVYTDSEKCSFINILSGEIRISITSKCNMHCTYCHAEGKKTDRQLSCEEVIYIISNAMDFGIKTIRITGGEPTLHPEISIICKEIKSRFPLVHLGINTNGIESEVLLYLAKNRFIDRIVFGIDYFDEKISKKSSVGKSSKEIFQTISEVIDCGCRVEVDTMYDGDYDNIYHMSRWAIDHQIRIKILEEINDETDSKPDIKFTEMICNLLQDLKLHAGIDLTFNDIYAYDKDGKVCISFFHSLCRTRECSKCARMHMRITSDGKTKPCLRNPKTEFDLLKGNFQFNFLKGLCNLGIPPETT